MNDLETLNNLRLDIIGEFQAINQYETHANSTSNLRLKKLWKSIANEERVHVGELMTMLFELDPISAEMFIKGQEELNDMLKSLNFRK